MVIPPGPTASSTVWSITPTGPRCVEIRCERIGQRRAHKSITEGRQPGVGIPVKLNALSEGKPNGIPG
jgi:hypothetical protein